MLGGPLHLHPTNALPDARPDGRKAPGMIPARDLAPAETFSRHKGVRRMWILARGLGLLAGVGTLAAATPETEFLNANMAVMHRMMSGMATKSTGQVDADFVNMMEPHHQGAIEMAQLELRYGRNEHLRRIAQEIIVDQQQEISAMRLALGRPLPPAAPAPTEGDTPLAQAPKAH